MTAPGMTKLPDRILERTAPEPGKCKAFTATNDDFTPKCPTCHKPMSMEIPSGFWRCIKDDCGGAVRKP